MALAIGAVAIRDAGHARGPQNPRRGRGADTENAGRSERLVTVSALRPEVQQRGWGAAHSHLSENVFQWWPAEEGRRHAVFQKRNVEQEQAGSTGRPWACPVRSGLVRSGLVRCAAGEQPPVRSVC